MLSNKIRKLAKILKGQENSDVDYLMDAEHAVDSLNRLLNKIIDDPMLVNTRWKEIQRRQSDVNEALLSLAKKLGLPLKRSSVVSPYASERLNYLLGKNRI